MGAAVVSTDRHRKLTVLPVGGEVGLFVTDTEFGNYLPSVLTQKEALQLAVNLTAAAEGKLQEPKYYLHVVPDCSSSYINKRTDIFGQTRLETNTRQPTSDWQTQFTQGEIDSDPRLKLYDQPAFKEVVPDDELE